MASYSCRFALQCVAPPERAVAFFDVRVSDFFRASSFAEAAPADKWVFGCFVIPAGKPKGSMGGRAKALLLIDSILGEDEVQNRMASALREAIMDDPVKFFRQIIMPLMPSEVKMKVAEGAGLIHVTA